MFSFDPLVEKIFEKFKDAQLAPVFQEQINLLREHLVYMGEKTATAEKELAKAEVKLEVQAQELERLRSQLAAFDGRARLVEIGPCFVKETADGRPLEGVYCPDCKMPMNKEHYRGNHEVYYLCMKCSIRLPAALVESPLIQYKAARKIPD